MGEAGKDEEGRSPEWLPFLGKLIERGSRVASLASSSAALAAAACEPIDPARPQVILELGAGTGSVTRVALERMHRDSILIAFEIDPDFAAVLRPSCPEAVVLEADVRHIARELKRLGVGHADVVLSGLPTHRLPHEVNAAVFGWARKHARNAPFSHVTVMPGIHLPLYRRLFEEVAFRFVAWNLPPAGVYHCRGIREDFLRHLPGEPRASPARGYTRLSRG